MWSVLVVQWHFPWTETTVLSIYLTTWQEIKFWCWRAVDSKTQCKLSRKWQTGIWGLRFQSPGLSAKEGTRTGCIPRRNCHQPLNPEGGRGGATACVKASSQRMLFFTTANTREASKEIFENTSGWLKQVRSPVKTKSKGLNSHRTKD